mgnify:CR=1 FL=1
MLINPFREFPRMDVTSLYVSVKSSCASRPEQIEDNVKVVQNLCFTDVELDEIEAILRR